ncbi:hypothetical protein M0804_015557 [Polistes exclamans]|nr:hypothetical protein M0804_015557 [Polistes exclamans]
MNVTSLTRGLSFRPSMNISNGIVCAYILDSTCYLEHVLSQINIRTRRDQDRSVDLQFSVPDLQFVPVFIRGTHVSNPARRFIIHESVEEENPRPEGSLGWNWQKNNNTPTIWEYSGTCGVKNYVLDQLETNYGLLDLFFMIFDDNLWDIVVTVTNRYAEQIMSNGRRRKLDNSF